MSIIDANVSGLERDAELRSSQREPTRRHAAPW